MRATKTKGHFTLNAIAGSHVVTLSIDAPEPATEKLLGFAIHRTDHKENEQYFLKGFKTFKETEPDAIAGTMYSTFEHPVQSFLWADFTAKPEYDYTYKIIPVFNKPKKLEYGDEVVLDIKTESEDSGKHAIYFNRGVAGSQAYARKFNNAKPEDVPERQAFKWLSRGLEEAILEFIGEAKGESWKLRASVYEFDYEPVLKAFSAAKSRGVDIKIIYDSRKDQPKTETILAVRNAGIEDLMIPRTQPRSYISHNKFIVLLKNNIPVEVWTGSTNFTKGGIFGQSNVGHRVRDEGTALEYFEYWNQLANDPASKILKNNIEERQKDFPASNVPDDITTIFSPRNKITMLETYANLMDQAKSMVNFTAAFGVHPLIANVLQKDKDYLRFLLLEKHSKNAEIYTEDKDVIVAIGSVLDEGLDRWTKETLTGYNRWVNFVHNKFMILDGLSQEPMVITGSANFSENSIKRNDENTLVIKGNIKVADIYLGEFFRLFNHHYFRYIIKKQKASPGSVEKESSYLMNNDSWVKDYYTPGKYKYKRRKLFTGMYIP